MRRPSPVSRSDSGADGAGRRATGSGAERAGLSGVAPLRLPNSPLVHQCLPVSLLFLCLPVNVNLTNSHSRSMNAPVDSRFWDKIHADLKARNYSRPNLKDSAYGACTRGLVAR
jgi:hypothetical protein